MDTPPVPNLVGDGENVSEKWSPAASLKSSGSRTTLASVSAADFNRKEQVAKHTVAMNHILKKVDWLKSEIELEAATLEEGEAEFKSKSEDLEELCQEENREALPEEKKDLKQLRTKLDRDASVLKRRRIQSSLEIANLEREVTQLIKNHEAELARIDMEEEQEHEAKTAELREKYRAMMNQKLDVTAAKNEMEVKDTESVYFDSLQEVHQRAREGRSTPESQQQETMASALHAIAKILENQEAKGQTGSVVDKVLIRQAIGKELPIFSGKPEQWHTFYSAFHNTTKLGGYDDASNVERLRKCLKGDAFRCVETLLVSGDSLAKVMDTLEMRFGQPEVIITSLVEKIRSMPAVKDGAPQAIIDFGTAVQNLVTTIQNLKMDRHLENPILLSEFKNKLPYRIKVDWEEKVFDKQKQENLSDFNLWLERHVRFACKVYVPKLEAEEKPRRSEEQKTYQKPVESRPWDYDNLPTAAGLVSGKQEKSWKCLLCDGGHPTVECHKEMSHEEKKEKIAQAKACYICLKRGHFAAKCNVAVQCSKCFKRHQTVMCRSEDHGGSEQQFQPQEEYESTPEKVTANTSSVSCIRGVLLKTMVVRVRGPRGSMMVRLMSDEGSQTSLVGRKVVETLGLTAVGSHWTRNVLCGGHVTDLHEEIQREVVIESLDGSVQKKWVLNEKPVICPGLPRVPSGPWIDKLKKKNIFLSDWEQVGADDPDIQILIGQDHWRELMTTEWVDISEDLTAVKTVFGWALCGCIQEVPCVPKLEKVEVPAAANRQGQSLRWEHGPMKPHPEEKFAEFTVGDEVFINNGRKWGEWPKGKVMELFCMDAGGAYSGEFANVKMRRGIKMERLDKLIPQNPIQKQPEPGGATSRNSRKVPKKTSIIVPKVTPATKMKEERICPKNPDHWYERVQNLMNVEIDEDPDGTVTPSFAMPYMDAFALSLRRQCYE